MVKFITRFIFVCANDDDNGTFDGVGSCWYCLDIVPVYKEEVYAYRVGLLLYYETI